MNSRTRTSQQIKKHPLSNSRDNVQTISRSPKLDKDASYRSKNGREKMALLQDVDKLKKKLRDEENIHRALQRAFNRPLGALPRLPPYLPANTQELLAEIAVLEEEVVRLEEQVVNYRQNLYQEAVFICSKRKLQNPMEYFERIMSQASRDKRSDTETSPKSVARTVSTSSDIARTVSSSSDIARTVSTSSDIARTMSTSSDIVSPKSVARTASTSSDIVSDQPFVSLARTASTSSDVVSDQTEQSVSDVMNGKHACNRANPNSKSVSHRTSNNCMVNGNPSADEPSNSVYSSQDRNEKENKVQSFSNVRYSERKLYRVKTPVRKSSFKRQPSQKSVNSPRKQPVNKALGADSEPNKISEDILKCLSSIFTRMSGSSEKRIQAPYSLSFGSHQDVKDIQDPYGTGVEFKDRDIGMYKGLCIVDAISIDLKRKRNALFLLHKLKLLLGKLARVNLDGLSHQHKLAFWINTYNSCMMNAFLEHGIPDSPEKVVLLMREATITVGGQKLNAITIEHFILRLPFYMKQGGKRAAKGDDLRASNMFGLKCAEPLVTFALSCGSWSSPAVRVYTASQIESELEAAKKEYLQAAVGISKSDKFIIPKLLDWYQLDFAKDLESLLDWICLQLPDELRKEALECLERKQEVSISELVEVSQYDFTFRYLIHA